MKNTAGFAKRLGCETPKERNRQVQYVKKVKSNTLLARKSSPPAFQPKCCMRETMRFRRKHIGGSAAHPIPDRHSDRGIKTARCGACVTKVTKKGHGCCCFNPYVVVFEL